MRSHSVIGRCDLVLCCVFGNPLRSSKNILKSSVGAISAKKQGDISYIILKIINFGA